MQYHMHKSITFWNSAEEHDVKMFKVTCILQKVTSDFFILSQRNERVLFDRILCSVCKDKLVQIPSDVRLYSTNLHEVSNSVQEHVNVS